MHRNLKIKLFLFFFLLFAAIAFALLFPRLTLPFGFSYIVYLMAQPLASLLMTGSKKQRIFFFSLLILGVSFSLFPLFAAFYNIDTDFSKFSSQLPEIQKTLQDKYFVLKVYIFEKFGYRLNIDPVTFMVKKMETSGALLLAQIPDYLSSFFEWLLLVPMFLYFFFFQSKKFGYSLVRSIPNSIFEKTYVLFSQFNTKFGEYIIAKFIEATILGTSVTIGLMAIGFPYPFILGFVAGITNILPYIGPILGFVPAVMVALLTHDPKISMFSMTLIYLVANLIDMVLVFPLLVSKVVNLNPIIVVVSVIVGGQLGGVVGMIFIIPFIAFFKLLFEEIYKDLSVQL
ncbi:MAG: AI-2E family transporter [Bdellovibrionales bacterium]|nr:AI-2E family transporter [Bdellovibrionales bacterium]